MNTMETYMHIENRTEVKHSMINAALKRHKVERLDFSTNMPSDLKNYTKVMFVRDPIERLVSAFNDKFHPGQINDFYFKKFGREISRNYQGNGRGIVDLSGRNVTFEEFVRYLVDLHQRNETNKYDEHWASYKDLCLPCNIDYDIIGL